MPRGKATTAKKSEDNKKLVRGTGGSSFVECPNCKKSVPAIFGKSHQEECAKKQTSSNNDAKPKDTEVSVQESSTADDNVPKKRKVENEVENEEERDQKKGKTGKSPHQKSQEVEEEEFAPPEGTTLKKKAPSSPTKEEIDSWINGKSEEKPQESSSKPPGQSWWSPQKKEKPAPVNMDQGILKYLTEPTWIEALQGEFNKDYFKQVLSFLEEEKKKGKKIYPPENEIFNALNLTPLNKIKVVIIGQDPYHGPGQAHGLCFSVKPGVTAPPSLKNIYKELKSDIGESFRMPANNNGFLEPWTRQGVLMLNATLTVEAGQPNSHQNIGWQTFTDAVIKVVNEKCQNVVYILWGNFAQKKAKGVNGRKNLILNAAHPSPYSADKFFGCKVFSKTNDYLKTNGKTQIDWNLEPAA